MPKLNPALCGELVADYIMTMWEQFPEPVKQLYMQDPAQKAVTELAWERDCWQTLALEGVSALRGKIKVASLQYVPLPLSQKPQL